MTTIGKLLTELDEGVNDNFLYHATTAQGLVGIITSDSLESRSSYIVNDELVYGCSLTRDIRFAKSWIKSEAIIVFDKDKIKSQCKLVPRGYVNPYIRGKWPTRNKSE